MTSGEMAAHRRKNGIVLLPLGCFEMHGVQVGMSCDTFLVEAACRIVADEWDAVIMPPIHYTYPGATGPWPGSVSISPREALDCVMAVSKAILKNGFKRLVLISLHGPSNFVIQMTLRSIFEETGETPILFAPDYREFCQRVEEEFGQPHGEAAGYLASLYICGRHGEFDPAATEAETLEGPRYPFDSASRLRQHGATMPYYFVKPNNHVGRYPGMTLDDAPRLAEIYQEVTLKYAKGLPEDYEKFQSDMRQAMAEAPWKDLE